MTKIRKHWNAKDKQSGVALIAALIALLLVAAITAGMIILSTTETNISSNFRDQQRAYFSSRAGLAEVRDRMRPGATDSVNAILPLTLPGSLGGVVYITNPLPGETVNPWNTAADPLGGPRHYPDDEICTEITCVGNAPAGAWYTNPPGIPGSGSATYAANPQLSWKWVRVMAKINRSDLTTRVVSVDGASGVGQPTFGERVCWDKINNHEVVVAAATCQAANTNYHQVYEITALAVTTSGSRRMAQFEVTPGTFPTIPGAMVFDGPGASFPTNPNSAVFSVNGQDAAQGPNGGAGCSAPANQPAIGTYSNGDTATLNGQLNRPGSYTSNNPYPTTDAVANVNGQMPSLNTVDGLTVFESQITSMAGSNVYTAPAGPSNMGTNAAPVINVINGDFTLGPTNAGAGILLVTGALTLNGNFSYNGLVLVIGKGNVTKTGGGNGTLNGSLFLANLYTDTTYAVPIPLGSNLPPGPTLMNWSGGGNATIQYDSCWINDLDKSLPYRLVTSREMVY